MQIKKPKIFAAAAFSVLTGIFVIFVCIAGRDFGEKETVTLGSFSWPSYTFETAAERATTIVYGEVVKKGRMQGGSPSEYQTDVTVDVIEWVKGDAKSGQIIFLEMGGETKTQIYRFEGVTPVQIGERYVFFLNEYGAFLSPRTLVSVTDGEISTHGALLPETEAFTTDTIPVHDYLEAIRNVC